MNNKLTGGCLCGNIRYEISGQPYCTEYCHCRMCQKSIGAVAVTWMDVKSKQLSWINNLPLEYASSKHIKRGFCPQCGASITFNNIQNPESMTLTIATLDDPELVKPMQHIYTKNAVSWLNIKDDCQRFSQAALKKE